MFSYNGFLKKYKLFESAPIIPNDEKYWIKKGKSGKKVALYFHDDLDGIYSAIAMKGYLEKNGFDIVKYGIVNYQEGWNNTELDPNLINIALDYAENVKGIDVYIDHHGEFKDNENKELKAIKTKTSSAYEGIMDQLGLPVDSTVLNVIDMIDSAKYDEYNIDVKKILTFDIKDFKNKYEFAAVFNQLLKRSDYKTFIEVVANCKDINPSIYNIYRLFKILYPANNLDTIKLKKYAKELGFVTDEGKPDVSSLVEYIKKTDPKKITEFEKDFINDAYYRLEQMISRTIGNQSHKPKDYIDSQETFKKMFSTIDKNGKTKISLPGYQIIGNLCFVPSGTFANPIRARAILERELENDERIPIIEYKVEKQSPLYEELKLRNGQTRELVGDIKKISPLKATLLVKDDVTNDKNVEGIKGVISVENDNVIFKAKQPIFWILLQYGNTLQVCTLHNFDLYVREYLPKLKDGTIVDNLSKYCENLLCNFIRNFGYDVNRVPKNKTVAGGHRGIGSITNIFGEVENPDTLISVEDCNGGKYVLPEKAKQIMRKYVGVRFLDLFRNKMISDLSGVKFDDLSMSWGDPEETTPPKIVKKEMTKEQIRKAQEVQKQYKKWKEEKETEHNDEENEI